MPQRSTVIKAAPRLSNSSERVAPPTRASISSTLPLLADTVETPALLSIAPGSLVSLLPTTTHHNSRYRPAKALEGFTESLNKELLPSWNIKASIIEPGGFETRWSGDLHQHPQPPAYSGPDTPTSQWRDLLANSGATATGNAEKAATALLKLSHVPANELPTRVQLGTDAWAIVKIKAECTIRDTMKWSEISHSTNNDGVDKEALIKFMASVAQ